MRLARKLVWPAAAVALLLTASPAAATFPGGNGKIAFSSPNGIETIEPDGSNRAPLAIDANPSVVSASDAPAWSADGKRIAFLGWPAQPPVFATLYTANADGSNTSAITRDFESPRDPAWSRDGSKIVFSKTSYFSQGWGTELDSINLDGTGLTHIRSIGLGQISYPDWSPVRDEIAYVDDGNRCDTGGGWFRTCNAQIWIIAPDGTRLAMLGDDKGSDYQPSWSPDGSKIAFSSTKDQASCISLLCGDIYTMNADGTGTINRLTTVGGNTQPVWSPDGKKIAFVSTRDGPDPTDCYQKCDTEIYVMNADGSGQTNLSNTAEREFAPDWQALSLPTPADFKNAAQFCKAERARLGNAAFRAKYGNNGGCVNQARRG